MRLKSLLGALGLVLALASAALTTRVPGTVPTDSDEATIARVTARVLQDSAYAGHPDKAEVSRKVFEGYLELLDPSRLYFLDPDIQEFAADCAELDSLMIRKGDTHPAHQLFDRFLQRLGQRVAYVQELLRTEKFDFTSSDSFQRDRHDAPRPRDLAQAKQLWRQVLRYEYLAEKLSDRKPGEIAKVLSRRYDRTLHTMQQCKPEDVMELYLDALAHAYDPHSDYLGHRQAQDFSIAMNLSLVGVGAALQPDDGYSKISELVPGGPAARCKQLKVGDRIVAVAQDGKEPVDIVDMPLPDAVSLIRGAKGTVVRLTVIPANSTDPSERKIVTLVRDEIKLEDQQAKAQLVELKPNGGRVARLGVIDLPSFYSGNDNTGHSHPNGASADVAKLLQKLKEEQVQGIILDLRHNGGGSLEEAIALTGLFIKRGPVVQTRDSRGDVHVESDPDPTVAYDGPLVVLTSRLSASASEILAGALQDYGRALVVGDPSTFGKGTVQTLLPLTDVMHRLGVTLHEDPGELKFTVRKFYRPDGTSTQLKGVASDIVIPSPTAMLKVGEAELHGPLPWDTVPPAAHAELNRVAPLLSELKAASAARVATNMDFVWLREGTERVKREQAHPFVSLNEAQRRKEKAEGEAHVAARKKARASRPAPNETRYQLTVKNADQPGLPKPLSPGNQGVHAKDATSDEDALDAQAPAKDEPVDSTLEEAQRILLDYVSLLRAPGSPTVARHVPARAADALSQP